MTRLGGPSSSPIVVTPGGHGVEVWAETLSAAPPLTLAQLQGRRDDEPPSRLVVVSAHPDDETIGAGRLVAAWSRSVGPVTAVLATAGEACVDHVGVRPPGLAERRLSEWEAAVSALGATDRVVLGLNDGELADADAALEAGVIGVLDRVRDHGPVVVAAPWRHDPHPDHAAVGRAVGRVALRSGLSTLFFPVWLTYWSDPDGPEIRSANVWRLETTPADDLVRADALASFATQLAPLADGWAQVVPPPMLEHHATQVLLTDRVST